MDQENETVNYDNLKSLAHETPIRRFLRTSSNGGVVLLFVGFIALVWANTPWQNIYNYILEEFHLRLAVNEFAIDMHTIHWINDGLMTLFFLMVGLEIKREILAGELSSVKVATLPVFAAVGGMIVPIIIYKCFAIEGVGASGWGIPMATDIAFSIAILSMLGNRVPLSLKVFLTALAIVDDLGGVLVIAIFYTSQIQWMYLFIALGLFVFLIVMNNVFNYDRLPLYFVVGVTIWWLFLQSGIHSTIAGVLVAFTIPMRTKITTADFVFGIKHTLPYFEGMKRGRHNTVVLSSHQLNCMTAIYRLSRAVLSPLQYIEGRLHLMVNYGVLPLFALANSGIVLYNFYGDQPELFSMVTVAIAVSLFVGKTIGITLFSWIAVKLKLADMPEGARWKDIFGVAMLGGIGFTMSLFITTLAFTDPDTIAQAKIGIFVGSIISGVVGYAFLKRYLPDAPAESENEKLKQQPTK